MEEKIAPFRALNLLMEEENDKFPDLRNVMKRLEENKFHFDSYSLGKVMQPSSAVQPV
jgi:hypothetical protein